MVAASTVYLTVGVKPRLEAAASSALGVEVNIGGAVHVGVHEGVGEHFRVLGGDTNVLCESSCNLPQVRRLKSFHCSVAHVSYALR